MTVQTVFDRVDVGVGWEKLAEDERDSTVAYFVTGWKYLPDGTEVLIWRGTTTLYAVDEEGDIATETETLKRDFEPDEIQEGYVLEGVPDTEVGDGKKYVVEYHPGEDSGMELVPVEELEDAVEVADKMINGEYEDI